MARLTGIDALSRRHPAGYDMPIGEMGQGLSGGQRQQVSLARCLLLDPTILLMDEPTSSMDTASEALFIGQLKKVVQDKTLVIVTHRTAVLELVDRIIVLEDGKILADGAKDVIMAKLRQSPRKATAEQNVVRSASGVAGNQEAAANA